MHLRLHGQHLLKLPLPPLLHSRATFLAMLASTRTVSGNSAIRRLSGTACDEAEVDLGPAAQH